MKLPFLGITGCYHLEWHQMLSRSKFPKHPLLIKKESLVLFLELCPRAMNMKKETFFWGALGNTGTMRATLYITFQAIQSFSIFLQTIKDSPMWITLIGLSWPFCGEFPRHIKMKGRWSQGVVLWPLQYYSTDILRFLLLQLFPSGSGVASSLAPSGFRI